VVVELRKATGLSVPRREPAAAGLADESVSVFGLWYLVDVHHLDCPLLFGCAKKASTKFFFKRKRLTSMKKTADFHQSRLLLFDLLQQLTEGAVSDTSTKSIVPNIYCHVVTNAQ
jgi:hypothetical protein